MAKPFLTVLSFALLYTFAVRGNSWQQGECQINRINAQEPSPDHIRAEVGVTEYWDHKIDDFQCAGVSIFRHRLQSKSLLVPLYYNAPILAYVLKGRGIYGVMISGCPETYESSQQSQQQQGQEGERSQRFGDRHQKIGHYRQGDIIAIPAGAAHWIYNEDDEESVLIVLLDITNNVNQLDQNPRTFFLAGTLPQQQQQGQQGQKQGSQRDKGNVFRGFKVGTMAEVFNIDEETARKLRGENDRRGHIIKIARGLQVIRPPLRGQEYGQREEGQKGQQQHGANGLEETICTAKIRQNIDNPKHADVYNPRAGRYTTINSFTLPVLSFFKLGAARGVLYKNAIMSPNWKQNAHSIVYVTRGEGRMQIVDHRGQAVFDGRVKHGQVVVVPQNFACVKQAGEQGFEWVEFHTNDNAMINTLSGRTSALRGLPASVIANAYQISNEQAQRIKYSREETLIFSGRPERSERFASA